STAEMGELLTNLDILDGDLPAEERDEARRKLLALLDDADARREKLARQVERADEFLGILRDRLG
ncbi:MAG: MerR family transcriptional regulator, partial [Brachybacterium sp.]|nr:MerR family transcriptional regulator [Brachybacterium sp.]